MSRSDTLPASARAYLDALHRHLADLDPADRADLTAPVEQRLADLTEAGEGPRQIERQFGRPGELAADLRAAAGYPPPPTGHTAVPASTAQWLREQSRRPTTAAVIRYLASLRPAWWAARGYLLVAGVLAAVTQGGGYRLHTLGSYKQAFDDNTPPRTSSLWLLIPVAAVTASIIVGHLTPRLPRPAQLLVVGLNAAAVLTLLAYPTWWMGPAFAFFTGLVN